MADESVPSRRRMILGRRRYPRVPVDFAVSIHRLDVPDVMARAVDMSLGGIRFQSEEFEHVPDEVMQAHFHFAGSAFFLFGRTVRTRELDASSREVGFAFSPMTVKNQSLLRGSLYGS